MKKIVTLLFLLSASFMSAQENETTAVDTIRDNMLVSTNSSLAEYYTPKAMQIVPPSPQSAFRTLCRSSCTGVLWLARNNDPTL